METIQDYVQLRAYSGIETLLYVTGQSPTPQLGISGIFVTDPPDSISSDNGGTVVVDAIGRRWKRVFDGHVNVKWFGVKGDDITIDTTAFQAAID